MENDNNPKFHQERAPGLQPRPLPVIESSDSPLDDELDDDKAAAAIKIEKSLQVLLNQEYYQPFFKEMVLGYSYPGKLEAVANRSKLELQVAEQSSQIEKMRRLNQRMILKLLLHGRRNKEKKTVLLFFFSWKQWASDAQRSMASLQSSSLLKKSADSIDSDLAAAKAELLRRLIERSEDHQKARVNSALQQWKLLILPLAGKENPDQHAQNLSRPSSGRVVSLQLIDKILDMKVSKTHPSLAGDKASKLIIFQILKTNMLQSQSKKHALKLALRTVRRRRLASAFFSFMRYTHSQWFLDEKYQLAGELHSEMKKQLKEMDDTRNGRARLAHQKATKDLGQEKSRLKQSVSSFAKREIMLTQKQNQLEAKEEEVIRMMEELKEEKQKLSSFKRLSFSTTSPRGLRKTPSQMSQKSSSSKKPSVETPEQVYNLDGRLKENEDLRQKTMPKGKGRKTSSSRSPGKSPRKSFASPFSSESHRESIGEGPLIAKTPATEQFRSPPNARKLKLKKSTQDLNAAATDQKPHLTHLRSLKNLNLMRSSGKLGPIVASTPQSKKLQQPALPHSRQGSELTQGSPIKDFVELKKIRINSLKQKEVLPPSHKAKIRSCLMKTKQAGMSDEEGALMQEERAITEENLLGSYNESEDLEEVILRKMARIPPSSLSEVKRTTQSQASSRKAPLSSKSSCAGRNRLERRETNPTTQAPSHWTPGEPGGEPAADSDPLYFPTEQKKKKPSTRKLSKSSSRPRSLSQGQGEKSSQSSARKDRQKTLKESTKSMNALLQSNLRKVKILSSRSSAKPVEQIQEQDERMEETVFPIEKNQANERTSGRGPPSSKKGTAGRSGGAGLNGTMDSFTNGGASQVGNEFPTTTEESKQKEEGRDCNLENSSDDDDKTSRVTNSMPDVRRLNLPPKENMRYAVPLGSYVSSNQDLHGEHPSIGTTNNESTAGYKDVGDEFNEDL